ncbi:hypothetical protein SI65_02155 [Aspergillus cristatus]|uniref:Alcohol dehydrogenase-like N-terminal domain-containing protein n=1 Tax=Aspergillus cristatus TaxID=573508 RepID=A0A1E3BK06_ASPCR|nr:hypothetical protein SI65_02155 [Aspergillus cristatus]
MFLATKHVVLEVGSAVKDVKKGDKVLLSYNFCGDCSHCTEGHPAYYGLPGRGPLDPDGQSTFSRVALVSGSSSLVRVPDSTPLELFAPLGCGLQTGAGSIFKALNVKPGSKVAIFGAGCVGLSAVMAAKIRGAAMIIAEYALAIREEVLWRGGSVAAEMVPFLIEHHNQGKYPLERLIRYYNVKDAQQAFQDMKAGKVLKPVLVWSESGLQTRITRV